MVIRNLKKLLLGVAILPLMLQPASAHVVWFDYDNGEYNLFYGHPESGPDPSYDVNKFKEATAYDGNRQIIPFNVNQKGNGISLTVNGNLAALTGFFDNGYRATTPDNPSLVISEAEVGQYQDARHYLKYTKALYDWSDILAQPFNQPLEIIPLQNPFTVTEGDNLPVQVFYQGTPISDVTVEHLGEVVTQDGNGIFRIPIGVEGLQVVEASYAPLSNTNLRTFYEVSFSAQRTSIPESSALLGLAAVGLLALHKKRYPTNIKL